MKGTAGGATWRAQARLREALAGTVRSRLVLIQCLSHQLGCVCTVLAGSISLYYSACISWHRQAEQLRNDSAWQETATRSVQDCISVWEEFLSIFHLY